ncbi:DNA polymerase III, subunit gamma and tau [Selenomonas sp. oral taxon 920]|uniref:DNA polymerase III subunit gamma/tau n=1 Tax=Selenomonas sp. oral taxon 920 TaxID=1884263 RepID=UPI000840AE69|nr:DNA polymerase III subunit gamma/tau [Selenomonas sp. oral taxon 920]AOH47201.1 DNA polymerase III, subunit gamma and tau [Selenomonas sp. oral taxon 920]
MSYVALYRRWRPETFADLVGQEHISRTLARAVTTGQTSHAYLFTGPRGTGKTSTAKILARALNCAEGPTLTPCGVCDSCRSISDGSSMDVFEIDAASNRGIDEIRDLRESVKFAPTAGHYKIYIIDEVHMLTTEAFNALLKTLEEPPERVLFILATTEPHKVPATIQSRCQRYDFHRITVTEIRDRLIHVCRESEIAAEGDALGIIAVQADGGMRDALSILDQCTALAEGTLTAERVQEALGLVGHAWIEKMALQIADRTAAPLLTQLGELLQNGRDLKQILAELAQYFRSLMIAGVGGALGAAELAGGQAEQLQETAAHFTQDEIMDILRTLNETMQEIRTSLQPRIAVEAMLIGLCRPSEVGGSETVAVGSHSADTARIARLEEEVRRLTARLAAGGTAKAGAAGSGAALAAPAAPTAAVQLAQKSAAPKRIARSENPGAAAAGAPRRLDGALWKKFQVRMKERHKLAASLLSGADYEGATETHFFIRPATDMARDYITKRHRAVFEEVMAEIAGRPLTVVCTGGEDEEASSVPPAAKTPEYPAPVAELLKIAGDGARVEEVTAPAEHRAPKTAPLTPSVEEDAPYEVYEPTADEEAEMFDTDELPPDADT